MKIFISAAANRAKSKWCCTSRFSTALRMALLTLLLTILAACQFVPQRAIESQAEADANTVTSANEAGAASAVGQDGKKGSVEDSVEGSADEAALASTPPQISPYLRDRAPVPGHVMRRFELAKAAMLADNDLEAEKHLLWLTAEHPRYSGPFVNLAIIYQRQNKPEQAETALQQAIRANATNLDAYNQLAILLRHQGRFEESEALYLQALEVWPQHSQTHLNLGILYDLYMGRFDQALQHYQSYQNLEPEPDKRIKGWVIDLQRRIDQVAAK